MSTKTYFSIEVEGTNVSVDSTGDSRQLILGLVQSMIDSPQIEEIFKTCCEIFSSVDPSVISEQRGLELLEESEENIPQGTNE